MKAIKRKILYPVLKYYTPNKVLVAILSSKTTKLAYDIATKKIMNDVSILSFKVPFDNTLISTNSAEMLVKLENDFYIIKTVKLSDEDKRILEITCEFEATECKGIKCEPLDLIGQSPEQLFNAIISSPKNVNLVGQYKWLGTDIVDTNRSIQTEDSVSVFANWLTMCNKFDNAWMEISTDENGQKWFFLRKNGKNHGKFIRKGQGLKALNLTFDTTGIFTRMYGYGSTDENTNQPINFISENPTGKAYVENIEWYLAMGMTEEEIHNIPRCVQETDFTDDTIVDKAELFRKTKEELAKVAIPTIEGSISISDYSVYEDTSITEPEIGEMVIVIDQDIHYSITTQIISIERKYTENPFDITTDISNIIKYDSVLKDLQHTSDVVNKVTTSTTSGVGINTSSLIGNIDASLIKTGILKSNNGEFSFDLGTGTTSVLTQVSNTSDKQIASTEFVINQINTRQNIIVDTKTVPITVVTGELTLNIVGLGINPIIITNGDYSLNTIQILGVKNISIDNIIVYYSNALVGDCKFNYTYTTN